MTTIIFALLQNSSCLNSLTETNGVVLSFKIHANRSNNFIAVELPFRN